MATRNSARPTERGCASNSDRKQETAAAPPAPNAAASQAAGLDAARHAAEQRLAEHADILREVVFPAGMATALGLDKTVMTGAYKVYLDRLTEDAGCPPDPVARMVLEQLA